MHLQGPVPLDDPDYAERPFELQLVREVQAGNWVLLLGPRQHGKTSAFLRLRRTLNHNATQTVMVDLQRTPPFENYSQLATWFARQVATALGNAVRIDESDDVAGALAQALPPGAAPVVILVDEASNIANDDWRNAFFGQLRAISSERAAAEDWEVAKRLRFVFAGTFLPERLVAEYLNSPFNICERIETADIETAEIVRLAENAGLGAPEIATAIHAAVGGQPYLVQRLIQSALGTDDPLSAVQEEIGRLVDSDHVNHLFKRVVSDEAMTAIVSAVVRDGQVASEAGNYDQQLLLILGILKRERGVLTFRNRLYAETAGRSPQFARVVAADARRAVLFPLGPESFRKVASAELREVALTAQRGGVGAYQVGSCRIALAGFGTALEAILMDFLQQQSGADLAVAAALCQFTRHENHADPTSWRLVNLMRGARGLLGLADLDIPENLREWRNLIHPSVVLRAYTADAELAPEVCTAVGQLEIVLRDLP